MNLESAFKYNVEKDRMFFECPCLHCVDVDTPCAMCPYYVQFGCSSLTLHSIPACGCVFSMLFLGERHYSSFIRNSSVYDYYVGYSLRRVRSILDVY